MYHYRCSHIGICLIISLSLTSELKGFFVYLIVGLFFSEAQIKYN